MNRPKFTDAHLEAIRHAILSMAWQTNEHYEARREVARMLDKYLDSKKPEVNKQDPTEGEKP